MKPNSTSLTEGSVIQKMLLFAIPIFFSNLFQQLYNAVDSLIVGNFLGPDALAAVSSSGNLIMLMVGFINGISLGAGVLVARFFGAEDHENLRRAIHTTVALGIAAGAVLTVAGVVLTPQILRLMGTPEQVLPNSILYFRVYFLGSLAVVLYNMGAGILRAVGDSKRPLYFLILSAGINVVGDLVLIINFHMGVAGAAIATVASQGISGVLCLIYMIKKVPVLSLRKEHFRLDRWCVRNQISVGVPMALQFSITAVGTIMVQAALNLLGSTVIAAYTAACKVEQLVTQVFVAMGMTMATYCGQNRGVNDLDRIKKGSRIAFWISAVYAVFIYVAVQFALPWIIRLFVSENIDEVLVYARTYIVICGAFFIPLGMIYIYRNVMQSCGYALMPMMGGVVELLSRAVLAVVAASLLSYEGVCLANASAWCFAGIFLFIAYRFTMKKMERDKLAAQEQAAAQNN